MLEVHDLAVARGGARILEGVTFFVGAGQALLLVGPNGVGKTTVLRTLAGLQPPLEGSVTWTLPDAAAYAAHADGIKPTLTVRENLRFWAAIFGTGAKAVEDAIDRFSLAPLAERAAGRLSAGQKRRLGLARLLVAERPVWLMDEPTVSLDSASVAELAGVVRDHLAAGGAAVIATHAPLGLEDAMSLDLDQFRSRVTAPKGFEEAFA